MTEKASTKKLGSKTPSTEISGDVDKVAGAPQQDDEKVPVEGEHMPRAIAQFLLELNVGLNTLDKLYDSTYYEFDKIMLDDTGSDDPIDVSELLEMNAFLEILNIGLHALWQKAQTISDRFRKALLEAGVDAAELAERTNQMRKAFLSDKAERMKESILRLPEQHMAIRAQIIFTFNELWKLHGILKNDGNDHEGFGRIEKLALELIGEIDRILSTEDGGEEWKMIRPDVPK